MTVIGVRQRHGRKCKRAKGCACPWEASVYSKRDRKKIRKTFTTKAAAVAWRDDSRSAVRRKALRAPTAMTVQQASDELLEDARRFDAGLGPGRYEARHDPQTRRGADVAHPAGDRFWRLTDVEREDVQELADRLTAEGLSASTVQNQLDPLRVIYRRAIRRDLVSVDPTKGSNCDARTADATASPRPTRPEPCSTRCKPRIARYGRPRCMQDCDTASFAPCGGLTSTSRGA